MHNERINASAAVDASVIRGGGLADILGAQGTYEVECVGPDGVVKWRDTIHNLVTTPGKNDLLDKYIAGSGFTQVGPFMGLISSVSYSTIAAADTMASHAGWTEAGGTNAPTYTSPRKTPAWSAASGGSKAMSASLSFPITSAGTVKGAFLVLGTGAVTTIDNTAGTLFSAGLFSGGDKVVANLDTLNVSYSLAV